MTNVSLSGVRVLVVEDEMMISMLLEDMLSDLGCTPIGLARGTQPALKLIEHAGFDVAILNVNLNGEDSYPIADALAASAIPFVFASRYIAGRLRDEYRSIPPFGSRFNCKNWSERWLQRSAAAGIVINSEFCADFRSPA